MTFVTIRFYVSIDNIYYLATFISISLSPPVSGVASDGGCAPAPQEPYSGAAAAEAEQEAGQGLPEHW